MLTDFTDYSRALYCPSSHRYVSAKLESSGLCWRTAIAGDSSSGTCKYTKHRSFKQAALAYEELRRGLEPAAYEVYAHPYLSGDLPVDPPPKRDDHVFLDDVRLGLLRGHALTDADRQRLRAIGSPWALLLEVFANGKVTDESREQLRALRAPRSSWTSADLYAVQLAPTELEGLVEYALGTRAYEDGAFVEAERHLARAEVWLPCTETCAAHARALHKIAGRETQAFALASRYGQFGGMEAILSDPRFAAFEADAPKKGIRWTTFADPCTDEELARAEGALGHPLDPRYRALAREIGAATLHGRSPKAHRFLTFEPVTSLVEARDTFRAWFAGEKAPLKETPGKRKHAPESLLPIASSSSTAGLLLMELTTTACFAWDPDGLFELVPLAPSVDELVPTLKARSRWPFA